jgi:chemotaxis methyl-accepting protein methylase
MILCRNLAFTYFDNTLQLGTVERLWNALRPGGILVTGVHELLPGPAMILSLLQGGWGFTGRYNDHET